MIFPLNEQNRERVTWDEGILSRQNKHFPFIKFDLVTSPNSTRYAEDIPGNMCR